MAIAILEQEGQYLLQLRDDIPTILFPGHWALFGGHLEPGETPLEAVKREIWEEIGFKFDDPQYFRLYADEIAQRHVFFVPLTVSLSELHLQEGWDFALVSWEQIKNGEIYSTAAQQFRPLGDRHQRILLDFIEPDYNS